MKGELTLTLDEKEWTKMQILLSQYSEIDQNQIIKSALAKGGQQLRSAGEHNFSLTDKGTGKRIKLSDFEKTSRAKRGLLILREVKTNPYRIIKTFIVNNKEYIGIKNGDIKMLKSTEIPILDRYSTGSQLTKGNINTAFINAELVKKDELETEVNISEEKPEKKVSLKEIDDRLLTIDDFINIDE